MSEHHQRIAPMPSRQRSKVTNGHRMFVEGGDARGPWARRRKDLCALFADDLGGASVLTISTEPGHHRGDLAH